MIISKQKKIQESIGGIIEIISFKKEKYFGDIYDKYIYKLVKFFIRFISFKITKDILRDLSNYWYYCIFNNYVID